MEEVILVDTKDNEIATGEKMEVHRLGKLHRAFSVFVFNSKGELMLQKRAMKKYHSPGLWSNTCCSHPKPGETTEKAAHRRLREEMDFDCELKEAFSFVYKVRFDNGLIENEFDHVFLGRFDGKPRPNPDEADDGKWINLQELKDDVAQNPKKYSYWLRVALDKVMAAQR
jgi:isopentenyl-diphosphate delta-isomerase